MRPTHLLLLAAASGLFALAAGAVTVSGVVTTTDGSSRAGFQITVEQVGGELPLFHATTDANGVWAVADPLLFGNIRVTASKAGYQLTPAFLDRFTSVSNISDANFSAAPLVPDLTVLAPGGASVAAGGQLDFAAQFPAHPRTLTFTLRNDGLAPLQNVQVSLGGPQVAEFAVSTPPPTTLAVGASATVTLTWFPTAAGLRQATLTILSNDPDESPFVVQLAGVALDPALLTVTTNADAGPGSLREALAQGAAVPGEHRIGFAPALAGATIALLSELSILDADGVNVDAGDLSAPVILEGRSVNRHFRIAAGAGLTLTGCTLRNGRTGEDRGGSVRNEGRLVLRRCTFYFNLCLTSEVVTAGGAIYNSGQLTLDACVLDGNVANTGAGIYHDANATLTATDCLFTSNGTTFTLGGGAVAVVGTASFSRCTFTENVGISQGGAVYVSGTARLDHCTLVFNVTGRLGQGGGIYLASGSLDLTHCTLTGNLEYALVSAGTIPRLSYCIVDENTPKDVLGSVQCLAQNLLGTATPFSGTTPILAASLLAPLGNYGGPTPTRASLPGSPARNAGSGSTALADQRGFPTVGVPDLGAYESGTLAPNFDAYIWETLPASASAAKHAPTVDFDGDGRTNFEEWLALTDAADARSAFTASARSSGPSGTDLALEFRSAVGRRYRLLESSALDTGAFGPSAGQPELLGNGQLQSFNVVAPAGPRRFYRVEARP